MTDPPASLDNQLIAEAARTCACFNLRKACRTVTQTFDQALQESGLRATQVVILMAIQLGERVNLGPLADDLVLDRSTLTRNLGPLVEQGLVLLENDTDARSKSAHLTDLGRQQLSRALPLWQQAQQQIVGRLGEDRWERMVSDLAAILDAAR